MIIVGAKGLAKELLQIISIDMMYSDEHIVFFDNVSQDLPERLYGKFIILKSFESVKKYLATSEDKYFVLGLGQPDRRKFLYDQFVQLGAKPITVISKNAEVGNFGIIIGEGTSIMSGAKISNSVTLGKGCLIYYNTVITHDCTVGDFVELSPNTTVLGRCRIDDYSSLGASSVILPDVTIGNYVTVGAGTVVLKDVSDYSTIVGVPGKIIPKGEKI